MNFYLFFLLIFLFISNCNPPKYKSPCDPKSNTYKAYFLVRVASNNKSSYCNSGSQLPNGSGTGQTNSSNDITAFSITSPGIGTGIITGTNIAVTLTDYELVTSLVATFTHNGASINIGGTAQTSATTTNDFTTPKTYTVVSIDGSTKNYTITVSPLATVKTTASRVYGQFQSFSCGVANNNTACGGGTPDPDGLNSPISLSIDRTGTAGIFIADQVNIRVLHYPNSTTSADRVYGQLNNLFVNTNSGISSTLFANSTTLSTVYSDATGVYVSDSVNNRVLFFSGNSTTATGVYGQGSFVSSGSGTTTTTLNGPNSGIVSDSTGVYISDTANNRVLFYPGTSTTATRVYGQGGSFTIGTANFGGISANSLNLPRGLALDSTGLYIADTNNHRVLFYPGTSTTATRVYGQNGSFTSNTANLGGTPNANNLNSPFYVKAYGGLVYISDRANHRALSFIDTSTTATKVWGQFGSFTTNTTNNGGISANSLSFPMGLDVDSTGMYLIVAGNNRALFYPR